MIATRWFLSCGAGTTLLVTFPPDTCNVPMKITALCSRPNKTGSVWSNITPEAPLSRSGLSSAPGSPLRQTSLGLLTPYLIYKSLRTKSTWVRWQQVVHSPASAPTRAISAMWPRYFPAWEPKTPTYTAWDESIFDWGGRSTTTPTPTPPLTTPAPSIYPPSNISGTIYMMATLRRGPSRTCSISDFSSCAGLVNIAGGRGGKYEIGPLTDL